jgi:hypothetical protein
VCAGESLLFPDDARLKIQQLFQQLDIHNTGTLQAVNFTDTIPAINHKKQQLWGIIRSVIDFDGNGVIEPSEFIGYFLLRAIRAPPTNGGQSMSESLFNWRQGFINNVAFAVQEFEQFLCS